MIYLYIKTHRTGLKYFGKTTAKDPHAYRGSGTYWKRHCEKHGWDYATEVVGQFDNESEAKIFSLAFSKDNNIRESHIWANLKDEDITGGFDHINGSNKPYYVEKRKATIDNWDDHQRESVSSKKSNKGATNGMFGTDRSGTNNPRYGQVVSESTRSKISKANKGKIRTDSYKQEQAKRVKQMWDDGKFANRSQNQDLTKFTQSTIGTFWWTDGIQNKRSTICPGSHWTKGRSRPHPER